MYKKLAECYVQRRILVTEKNYRMYSEANIFSSPKKCQLSSTHSCGFLSAHSNAVLYSCFSSGTWCCWTRTGTGTSSRTGWRWSCALQEAAAYATTTTTCPGSRRLGLVSDGGRSSRRAGSPPRCPWRSSAVAWGLRALPCRLCQLTLGCSLSWTPEAQLERFQQRRSLPGVIGCCHFFFQNMSREEVKS